MAIVIGSLVVSSLIPAGTTSAHARVPWRSSGAALGPGSPAPMVAGSAGYLSVGSQPESVAYDPQNQTIFVNEPGSENVTVISATTDRVITSIPYGRSTGSTTNDPTGIAYDPDNNEVYAVFHTANVVEAIGASNYTLLHSIAVGTGPDGIAWDPTDHDLYVSNSASNDVTVISGSNDTAFHTTTFASGGAPTGIAATTGGHLYVTDVDGYVHVIADSNNSPIPGITLSGPCEGAVFDPTNGMVYVAVSSGNEVVELNGVTYVTQYTVDQAPSGLAFGGPQGYLYVASGTPSSGWVDVIEPSNGTEMARVAVGSGADGLAVVPSNGTVFVADETVDTVAVVPGASLSVTTTSVPPVRVLINHTVTFQASAAGGAPPYRYAWSNLPTNCTSADRASLTCAPSVAGTYSVQVTVTDLTNSTVRATLDLVVLPVPTFTAQFSEGGLPTGTRWSVGFDGQNLSSTHGTIDFLVPNGSYAFKVGGVAGFTPDPVDGTLTIDGPGAVQSIAFSVTRYAVTFTESGLPAKTSWSVDFNGTTVRSTNTSILVTAANGTYPFQVDPPSGYAADLTSGGVLVQGSNVGQPIGFKVASSSNPPPPSSNSSSVVSGLFTGTSEYLTIGLIVVSAVAVALAIALFRQRRSGGPPS